MHDIIYPTLDLFLYDLRNSLGDSQEAINQNRVYFQKKLPENIHEFIAQRDTDFEVDYHELLPNKNYNNHTFPFKHQEQSYSFEGYYYPVRLNDSYGLLLDCSINNQTEAQPAKCFRELKAEIERRLNGQTATIGQTWLISGWLPQSELHSKNTETIAKDCYKALMPGSNWKQDFKGQGEFLNASIFELSHNRLILKEETASATMIQSVQAHQHVVIIIYPDQDTAQKSGQFHDDWLRLFSYRHKILWAYGQSRFLKKTIKTYFTAIEEGRQSIKSNPAKYQELEQFQTTLRQVQDTLNRYTTDLNKLEFQKNTIDINLFNYKERLGIIQRQAEKNNLNFLDRFAQLAQEKYLLQITKDMATLELGLKVLEDTINTIRSRVEVDKAERDRNFQDTVAVIAVGWSVGSFVASLNKLGEDKQDPVRILLTNSPLVPKAWVEPGIPLVYTLSVAIVAAALTWLVRQLWARSR
jgi:hypothetical protein